MSEMSSIGFTETDWAAVNRAIAVYIGQIDNEAFDQWNKHGHYNYTDNNDHIITIIERLRQLKWNIRITTRYGLSNSMRYNVEMSFGNHCFAGCSSTLSHAAALASYLVATRYYRPKRSYCDGEHPGCNFAECPLVKCD